MYTKFPDLDMSLRVTRFMFPRWLMAEIPGIVKRPALHIDGTRRVRASKTISWLLRHGAESQKLPMRQDGYVCVQDLLRHPKLRHVTFLALEEIVKADEKQRYHLSFEPQQPASSSTDPSSWWIRANQGHSLHNVDVELTRILSADEIPMAVHGTTHKAWGSIARQGISRMARNHIHLAQGLPGANVTSGIRSSAQVFIFIDVAKAMKANIKFYLSSNGVVLTEGNDHGVLEPVYFDKVEFVEIKADQLMGPVEEEQCAIDAKPAESTPPDAAAIYRRQCDDNVSVVKGLSLLTL